MHAGKFPADDYHMGGLAETFLGRFEFKKKWSPAMALGEDLSEGYGEDSGLSVLCTARDHSNLNASRNSP